MLAVAWTAPVSAAPARNTAADACDGVGAEPAAIAGVEANGDILLGDGRIAALSGLALSPLASDRQAIEAVLDRPDLLVKPLSPDPDRWGRIRARIYASEKTSVPADLGERIAARGLALYRPDADASGCRKALLAAEATARANRAGLWSRAGAVVDASDRAAVANASAAFLVVEGAVASVGEARGRVYLNLGKVRTVDLAIVILGRNISAFESQGVALRDLTGRRIRARGLLDRRFGPQMEIAGPDALEVIGADGAEGEAKGR